MFLVNQKKKKANKSNKVFKSLWLKLLTIHAKCYWHFSNIFQFPYLHFVGNTSLPVFDIAFIGGCAQQVVLAALIGCAVHTRLSLCISGCSPLVILFSWEVQWHSSSLVMSSKVCHICCCSRVDVSPLAVADLPVPGVMQMSKACAL